MRIFVAGATGVLGRASVGAFVSAGHEVTGVARGTEKAALLREMEAEPVSVDLFSPESVSDAVRRHDVVCNFATKIPSSLGSYMRRSPWGTNNRLHREVSRHLVDGALQAGASRYLQHSVTLMYADGGDRWLDEDAPMDLPPHGHAVVEAERQAARFGEGGGTGIALRFSYFYGPATGFGQGMMRRIARTGFLPLPGRPDAFVSWIHCDDLGAAVVAALEAPTGVYNVTDDEPLTRREWADILAKALVRKRMRTTSRVPLGKRYDYLSRSVRVTSGKFKEVTGWAPKVASGRIGWMEA